MTDNKGMHVLGVILARAGSKSVPEKCLHDVLGRPMIEYTFDHAQASGTLDAVVLTTDSAGAKELARARGIEAIDRPPGLATDTATVDAAARHAVLAHEARHRIVVDVVALLYGNIPVRADGIIDRAVRHLVRSGADSVRTVAPVSKQHPDWLHRLDGDVMVQYRPNSIYRRQDLDPLYYHDGAVLAVTRASLFREPAHRGDHFAFLGDDRRAIVQRCEDTVDVDEMIDIRLAEALLPAETHATADRTI